jgi:biopolymer transport protein ExbD
MFESERPATKSNLTTLVAVVIVVFLILLVATWLFTRA